MKKTDALCEFCFRRSIASTSIGPLCRAHKREYDEGIRFDGCITRTEHDRMDEIRRDPVARHLLTRKQGWERMSAHAVLNSYGDPRKWDAYKDLTAAGFVPPPETPRPPAVGTHEHWAIHQNHWTGEWYIQRAVRQGLGTAYDSPLPEHRGFKTKKAALAVKRTLGGAA